MNVISFYFALWVTVEHKGQDILYSTALSLSMLAVAVSVPIFGTMSDASGKRRGPLITLTLLCVIATAWIGTTDHLWIGLALFMLANYGYQSALVFYNGMLPSISKGSHVGLVSGYGVSLGYLGSIAGLLMVKSTVEENGLSAAFLPTAALFLIFALPCFLFVKDPEVKRASPIPLKKAFANLQETFLRIKNYKSLFKFILIHFLVLDAVNTIIAFMAVYANKVIGFNESQTTHFLISSTIGAMLGSFIIGILVKYKGTIWSYWLVLWTWVIALSLVIMAQGATLFWLAGPIAGVGMGGVWVVSRALIVELSPPERVGEFFGFYGFAGKAASIIGPMLWGGIVWALSNTTTLKYRVAVAMLLSLVLGAAYLFRSLSREIFTERQHNKSVDIKMTND